MAGRPAVDPATTPLAIRRMAREAEGRTPSTARTDALLDERSEVALPPTYFGAPSRRSSFPPFANEQETAMSGKFEISKDKSGKFRFHLKAANGEIIAASQGYETKANARRALSRSGRKRQAQRS